MPRRKAPPTFVDAFAGCGGLSLGLLQAGFVGRFAIEKNEQAFATFKANLLSDRKLKTGFRWPRWLPKEAIGIEKLIRTHREQLEHLKGTINVLAGGPPCQGFSTAGRRRHDDPRNQLFKSYIKLVNILEPDIVLIENVRGFTMDFTASESVGNYSDRLCQLLSKKYDVYQRLIDLSIFGVPQQRVRYFLIAVRPSFKAKPFELLDANLATFLRRLDIQAPISARSAISDMEVRKVGSQPSTETPGFSEICNGRRLTRYQKLMAAGTTSTTDLRLARHTKEIESRFADIIRCCHKDGRLNKSVSPEIRSRYAIRKQALRVLDPDRPSPTITSMPDDLLHYSEPRTLTVRENARLQSFPDWFEFKGKYTTGGERRRFDVPRFTQVANAVPPLAARAIGEILLAILRSTQVTVKKSGLHGPVQGSKLVAHFQKQAA